MSDDRTRARGRTARPKSLIELTAIVLVAVGIVAAKVVFVVWLVDRLS